MNSSPLQPWTPTPELLAAYADGELDCRPELTWMRVRIENWLAANPEAAADLEAQTCFSGLLASCKPVEPSAAAWDSVWAQISHVRLPKIRRRPAARWLAGLVVAGAAAACVMFLINQHQTPSSLPTGQSDLGVLKAPPQREDQGAPRGQQREVSEVVKSDQLEILHIPGADIRTLLAGHLPWSGPMLLVQPHEVEIRSPMNDNTGMELRMGSGATPIIWMPLPGDDDKNP